MHIPGISPLLLAAAGPVTDLPWYREPFAQALITIGAVVVPTFVAWIMGKRLRAADMWGRIATVLVAATCGGLVTWWNWPPRLGIDLKGGLILVYEVDTSKEADRAGEQGDAAGGAGNAGRRIDMDALVTAVSRRVNPGGQKEVTVRRYGLDQIEVIVPDVDQAEVDLIKRIVSSGGALEFRILANRADLRPEHVRAIELSAASPRTTVSDGGRPIARWVELDTEKMSADDPQIVTRKVKDRVEVLVLLDALNVTGKYLGRVSPGFDPRSLQPCVNFTFDAEGANRFSSLTTENRPQENGLLSKLGIVLDGVLQSAPVIREAISSSGQISGNFKQQDVDVLVEVLNAGSLPAALVHEPISEQKISPQLGEDTIRSGARAMALATAVVLLFMLAYYRFSGLVADLAVLLNIVLVLAVMISIKAAFTLAGLAGLVLSVGMAVDANVLIYERMREEVDRGAAVRMAIRNGFARAFSTILDSNLTTVITGVVLFAIGTDQLKGFAVTLILGLMLNLFTAVFCSRVVFDLAERNGWLRRLNMARIFGQPHFRFVAWMPVALCLSAALIGIGLVAAWTRGPGLFDIDFTGGSSVQLEFLPGKGLDVGEVRRLVGRDGAGLPDVAVSAVTAGESGADLRYKIDTSLRDAADVQGRLGKVFAGRLPTYSVKIGEIGPAPAGADGAPSQLPTVANLVFPDRISLPTLEDEVQQALAATGQKDATVELEAEGMTARAKPYEKWTLATSLDPAATRTMLDALEADLVDEPVFRSANTIGGKVAGSTKVTAVAALAASLVLIVLYVWVRFQNVAFGLAAVLALAHDVLVAVACLALSTFVAPFLGWALVDDFKISLDVVAALLTIIGFSINDTIVIFDRLREIRGKSRFVTADMVDRAVNQTLSRTILTSGTALLATFILYAFGGQGIHAFAFTMFIGIITGSYSTIYIASPIVLWLQHRTAGGGATARRPAPA